MLGGRRCQRLDQLHGWSIQFQYFEELLSDLVAIPQVRRSHGALRVGELLEAFCLARPACLPLASSADSRVGVAAMLR